MPAGLIPPKPCWVLSRDEMGFQGGIHSRMYKSYIPQKQKIPWQASLTGSAGSVSAGGIFGVFCAGKELDSMILVDPFPLRIFHDFMIGFFSRFLPPIHDPNCSAHPHFGEFCARKELESKIPADPVSWNIP